MRCDKFLHEIYEKLITNVLGKFYLHMNEKTGGGKTDEFISVRFFSIFFYLT